MTLIDVRQPGSVRAVRYAAEAPPFARALAQRLSLNGLSDAGALALDQFRGAVAVKSNTDPQSATVRADDAGWVVDHGAAAAADGVIVVDPAAPGVPLEGSDATGPAAEVANLLTPHLPPWTELAPPFWDTVKDLPAMPSLRIVEKNGPTVDLVGGHGHYEVHGGSDALTNFLAGLELFMDAVYAGRLQVSGTFSQFSVVTGASMKVLWNV
jgi:hypothetical protein